MDPGKRKQLEQAGWRVGSAEAFLQLSPEEAAYIDVKLKLSAALRTLRVEQGLSQTEMARRLRSSQSRVAKMEAGDSTVSIDLLVRAMAALGASAHQVGDALSAAQPTRPLPRRRGTAA